MTVNVGADIGGGSHRLKTFLRFIVCFLAVCLVFPTVSVDAQNVAKLENVKGDVRVITPGKDRENKGFNDMGLFAGKTVKTVGAGSFADVKFESGAVVRMMPNSELTLLEVEVSKDKLRTTLNLASGKIFNVVNKLSEGSEYIVKTGTATSGVKGTIFSVETTGATTVLMVKTGAVETANPAVPSRPVLVADLKKTTVKSDVPPSEPVPMTPEEIALFDILNDLTSATFEGIRKEAIESMKEDRLMRGR
jgi:hypothetical protein